MHAESLSAGPQPNALAIKPACMLQESLIAWTYDRDHFYSDRIPHNWNNASTPRHQVGGNTSSLPLKQQQHFMVWMRPSAQPSAEKLYAVIHQDIPAGAAPG